MSKHTPGPWQACHDGKCKCGYVFGDGGRVFVAKAIGRGDGVDPWPIEEIQRANARLIAAAPELLEACEEFVRKCECGEAKSKHSYKQMKAALAKARGEANHDNS